MEDPNRGFCAKYHGDIVTSQWNCKTLHKTLTWLYQHARKARAITHLD